MEFLSPYFIIQALGLVVQLIRELRRVPRRQRSTVKAQIVESARAHARSARKDAA